MDILQHIQKIIALLLGLCYAYQILYLFVPFLVRTRLPGRSVQYHRYAVLICARNEASVIGHLIDSIRHQDYPSDLVTIFVAADNCTDDTAAVAAAHGAVVYQRFDRKLMGKGYAMDFLLRQIQRDYGKRFDGFFVFDADNLLQPDYIRQMNRTFDRGYSIVTSYRNSKNYGNNWISAGYGLWFLREAAFLNHPRSLLGISCAVSGTGFLFSRAVMESYGGWPFHLLTEDIEFTIASILQGETVGYCPDAIFFDEQPVTFRQSWYQRMRWAKGYLQVFRKYGWQLFRGRRFSCFDMAMAIFPAVALSVLSLTITAVSALVLALTGQSLLPVAIALAKAAGSAYLGLFLLGALTTATQWQQLHASTGKKLRYTVTFPLFMLTYLPISFAALFCPVQWRPIAHTVAISLQDLP